MKNRILAGIMAMCLIGGTVVILECVAPVVSVATSAGTGTYGNLEYVVTDDQTITITDCDKSAVNVVIPSEIEGMPVTVIGMDAFKYCSNLVSVTIPSSVTIIDSSAFYGCNNIADIYYAGTEDE